ncbi:MAG TPA: ROK family protein [Acidimicrobiales bacterium]
MPIAIGVDVGGTKVLAVAVDPTRPTEILAERRVPTPVGDATKILEAIGGAARVVSDDLVAIGRAPEVVGIGIPGLVDTDGRLRAAPNLSGLVGVEIPPRLRELVPYPVVVDNDANCALWAEVCVGAGLGARDAVLVTLGTGIGGALVNDAVLRHGVHGFAGEPGHMVVDPSGPACPCGRKGCWERYASGSGLGMLARRAAEGGRVPAVLELAGGDVSAVDGEHLIAAARAGHPGAGAVLDEFAWWLALGIANLVNVLDPELILIGGGLADESDLFLPRTREELGRMALGASARTGTRVEVATLGSRAGAIGAALLATRVAQRGSTPG